MDPEGELDVRVDADAAAAAAATAVGIRGTAGATRGMGAIGAAGNTGADAAAAGCIVVIGASGPEEPAAPAAAGAIDADAAVAAAAVEPVVSGALRRLLNWPIRDPLFKACEEVALADNVDDGDGCCVVVDCLPSCWWGFAVEAVICLPLANSLAISAACLS